MKIILQIVHRKVWSIGGTGGAPLWYIKESIWTHSNPHEPTKNHQKVSRYLKISQASSSMQSHAESTMWYQMVIIDQYWSFICLVISIELFWGYGIPIITNLNHMYIILNHYNSLYIMDYHDHCNTIAPECTTGLLVLLASATGVCSPRKSWCPRNVWSPGGTGG